MTMIVHHLHQGVTPCQMIGFPGEWNEGHLWSENWNEVTCVECHHSRLKEFVARGQAAQTAVNEIISKHALGGAPPAAWPATAHRLPEEIERIKQATPIADGVIETLREFDDQTVAPEKLMYVFLIAAAKMQPGLGDLDNNLSDKAMMRMHQLLSLILNLEVFARAKGEGVSATNSLNLGSDNHFHVTGTASVPVKKNGS